MTDNEKAAKYAVLISSAIAQLFDEDSDLQINQDEFKEDDNLTHFIHALANMVPTLIYNQLTGDDKNQLQFNHIANQLCFQYGNRVK